MKNIKSFPDQGSGGSNSTELQISVSGSNENKVIFPGSLLSSSGDATTYKTPLKFNVSKK